MTTHKVALATATGTVIARKLADTNYNVAIFSSSGRGEVLASELGGIGVTGLSQNPADLWLLVDTALKRLERLIQWSTLRVTDLEEFSDQAQLTRVSNSNEGPNP